MPPKVVKNDDAHDYWDNQPVPKLGEKIEEEGAYETKTVDEVSTEEITIASTFEWFSPDLDNEADMKAVHGLLRNNYVEDDGNTFRFDYSMDFLRWAMQPPGYYKDWHVGVRKKSDKTMLCFISGIPLHTQFGGESKIICEINFLCICKKLRSLRMAPKLISEVTRRVNLRNIWQAVYTAGKLIPKPFTTAKYWHRSLNPKKLVAVNFSRIPQTYQKFRNPMEALCRHYALPKKPVTKNLRPMIESDCEVVAKLLTEYLSQFKVSVVFEPDRVKHWLMPRPGVLWGYVVEDPETKQPTDFISFYALPSSIIGNIEYPTLNAAYTYYYVAKTIALDALMQDALILATEAGFDVFNTVDIMDNGKFLEPCRFGPGDGSLHYYMYNWKLKDMKANEVGLVML